MKHFCAVPWLQQDLSSKKFNPDEYCCWVDKSVANSSRLDVQQQFIAGAKPPSCHKCWHAEDNNHESRREMENRFFDYILDLDIKNIETLVTSPDFSGPISHQINLSNTCNGACTTCGSFSSSAWGKYKIRMGVTPHPSHAVTSEFLESVIDFKTVKSLRLLGGEPLLSDQAFYIFTQLDNAKNYDCFISIITNGSIKITEKYKNILSKFKRLNICVSIDGTEKAFNYLRFPLKWEAVLDNIVSLRKISDDVTVSYTVSNLNIHRLDETIDWFNNNDLKYIVNYVSRPAYFAPDVQPGHKLWGRFCQEIEQQDKAKGIHIKDYIPEVWEKIQTHK